MCMSSILRGIYIYLRESKLSVFKLCVWKFTLPLSVPNVAPQLRAATTVGAADLRDCCTSVVHRNPSRTRTTPGVNFSQMERQHVALLVEEPPSLAITMICYMQRRRS